MGIRPRTHSAGAEDHDSTNSPSPRNHGARLSSTISARRGSQHRTSQDYDSHPPPSTLPQQSPRVEDHPDIILESPASTESVLPLPSRYKESPASIESVLPIPSHYEKSITAPPQQQDLPPPTRKQSPQVLDMTSETIINSTNDEPDGDARLDYETCQIDPPITLESLAELETARIFNNPKLRHDVNFDRELHFRPNIDGARGKQKTKTTERFWKAVEYELLKIEEHHGLRQSISDPVIDKCLKAEIKAISKRLPTVFAAVRDILVSLVPEAEQSKIMERLDVDFLMHQIVNGVLDMVNLASWLAAVIKTHCAPMRDLTVNQMEKTVAQAEKTKDIHLLAKGLRQLVDIMEAMKLDVANHQIRHIRLLLIKNTVDFQQRYNSHRIKAGKMDTHKSLSWLKSEIELTHNDILPSSPLDAVCSALLWDMISPHGPEPFTPSFYLDYDRLKSLSAEMHNYIHREISHNILIDLLPQPNGSCFLEAWTQLQTYLAATAEPQDWFESNIEQIATQITNIVVMGNPSSLDDQEQDEAAIFETAFNRLTQEFAKDSPVFARHKAILFHRVLPKLQVSVHKHVKLSAVELQDALVPHVSKPSAARLNGFGAVLVPAIPLVPADQDGNLVRRLTHITVLHWQVWADLLYLNESDYESNGVIDTMNRALSPTCSSDDDVSYASHAQSTGERSSTTAEDDEGIHMSTNGSDDGLVDGNEDFTASTKNDKALPDY